MWLDGVVRKPLVRNYTRARRGRTDGVILHVAAGESPSLYGWFSNPRSKASSHFYVRYDGTVEQYVDTDYISWASVKGDARCISIETEGLGGGTWTDKQVASLAWLIRTLQAHYGFPLRAMTSSKVGEKGVGYHALGVPANLWQKVRGISQTGGEKWSGAVGKICPGPARIRQVPTVIAMAGGGQGSAPQASPSTPSQPATSGGGSCVDEGIVSARIVQERLKGMGYYKGIVDGQAGPLTKAAVLAYQRGQKFHGKLASDGYWGRLEEGHYQWVCSLQSAVNGWKAVIRLGRLRVDGDYGALTVRAVRALQESNRRGAYQRAVTSLYGAYKARVDGIPGKAFCSMLGIPNHPYA